MSPVYSGGRYRAFVIDAAERSVKTAAQAALVVFVGGQVDAFAVDWADVAGVGLGGAVVSLLTSLASWKVNDPTTASLVKSDDTPPKG